MEDQVVLTEPDEVYIGQDDTDGCSSLYKALYTCGGSFFMLACLPLAIFGCGPIIQVPEGSRAIVLEHGKYTKMVGPGTYTINPGKEQYIIKSVQLQSLDVPKQIVLTKDNLTVTINAVVYYQINEIKKALLNVASPDYACSNLAQCMLRSIVGEHTLEELFSNRAAIVAELTRSLDLETDHWGLKITSVELKDIQLPGNMQRVMAAVAEAHREGTAKIIKAEAELKSAHIYAQAAGVMNQSPIALQLRYFQTLGEIASERSSTLLVKTTVPQITPSWVPPPFQSSSHAPHYAAPPSSSSSSVHAMNGKERVADPLLAPLLHKTTQNHILEPESEFKI